MHYIENSNSHDSNSTVTTNLSPAPPPHPKLFWNILTSNSFRTFHVFFLNVWMNTRGHGRPNSQQSVVSKGGYIAHNSRKHVWWCEVKCVRWMAKSHVVNRFEKFAVGLLSHTTTHGECVWLFAITMGSTIETNCSWRGCAALLPAVLSWCHHRDTTGACPRGGWRGLVGARHPSRVGTNGATEGAFDGSSFSFSFPIHCYSPSANVDHKSKSSSLSIIETTSPNKTIVDCRRKTFCKKIRQRKSAWRRGVDTKVLGRSS